MIKPINIEELPQKKSGRHKEPYIIEDVMGFVKSGLSCAEVIFDQKKKTRNVSASYAVTAKRIGAPVKVIQRDGRVFLIREDNNA